MSNHVTGRGRRTWLLVALLVSACLNVALVSFITARVFAAGEQPLVLRTPQQLFGLLEERLPPADAALLKDIRAAKAKDVAAARDDLRRARLQVLAVLVRKEFDAAAFRTAMEGIREGRGRLTDVTLEIITETVEKMSPQTRQGLVERFRLRDQEP
jgi:uncharacterized membrane protein